MGIGYTIDRLIRERGGADWISGDLQDLAILMEQAAQAYHAEMGHDSAPIRRVASWLDYQVKCRRAGTQIDPEAWIQSLPPGLRGAGERALPLDRRWFTLRAEPEDAT